MSTFVRYMELPTADVSALACTNTNTNTAVARRHHVYIITCTPNGKRYVGVSNDPCRRFRQHAAHPPRAMAADAEAYKPFHQHFALHVYRTFQSREAAEGYEAHLTRKWDLTTRSKGYNTLRGRPGHNQKYHFLRRNKLL
jgi:predicted GIY-YIG superfamily endonuclease